MSFAFAYHAVFAESSDAELFPFAAASTAAAPRMCVRSSPVSFFSASSP